MNKLLKKFLAVSFVFVLTFVLIGCGETNGSDDELNDGGSIP